MNLIDHIAFRCRKNDKEKAVKFFCDALGYKIQDEFEIYFDDEKKDVAMCTALEPSNRNVKFPFPHIYMGQFGDEFQEYMLAPEIFVSEGGSVVSEWVEKNGPGIHHIAIRVDENTTVEEEMQKWLKNGWAEEFSSNAIHCDNGLSQVFTRPSSILGVVFELIQRKDRGFCKDSVKALMQSSKGD